MSAANALPSEVHDGHGTTLLHQPWPAERVIDGAVTTAEHEFGITETLKAGTLTGAFGSLVRSSDAAIDAL